MGKWKCFHLAYCKMNRNNKYTIPNFIGKKGYSKQLMMMANKRQQIEKRSQLRVMQKH
jgi:hypothetical protein